MTVKLIDLQLIYGVAGAREKFEDLAFDLIKGEEPRAQKVRVSQGDGGIDAHVGDLTDPRGVHIYQCKFFPKGLDDSQKDQIRDSFKRCRDSNDFQLQRWTLCLPVDLSVPEKKWFAGWRDGQATSGVVIEDPWGASTLEGLLRQEKNKGLRDDYFKEEHVAQIGDMHGMMQRLAGRVVEVLRERAAERQQTKQADVLTRQAEYLDQFVRSLRDEHLKLIHQRAGEVEIQGKQPARWEAVISPSWIPDQPRIGSYAECWSIVQACQGGIGSWPYPEVSLAQRTSGPDWIEGTWANQSDVECWRFSPTGVFAHMFTVPDDNRHPPNSPGLFLYVNDAIGRLTEMFRFAANLAERAYHPGDGAVDISISLTGIQNRQLTFSDGFLRSSCCARVPELKNAWHCPRAELRSAPQVFAVKAARWFFERFNWLHVTEAELAKIQSQYLADC